MIDLVGHAHAVRQIQKGLEAGVTAFIVLGERGVGKATLVQHVAEQHFGSLDHFDLLQYAPTKASFGVNEMRAVIEDALDLPATEYKLIVLYSAERFTAEAADVLLKTLEEGVGRTRFILTATDPGHVRPTILSRCEQVQLARLTDEEVGQVLAGMGIEEDESYVEIGRGNPGRAVRAALGSLEAVRTQAARIIERLLTCLLWEVAPLLNTVADELLRSLIEEMMALLVDAARTPREEDDDERVDVGSYGGFVWILMEELDDLYRASSVTIDLRRHMAVMLNRARARIKTLKKVAA